MNRLANACLFLHVFPMSVQDVLEMANELCREDKALLFTTLGEQLAADFTPQEVEDIKRAVAEADAQFERGECMSTAQLAKELGV